METICRQVRGDTCGAKLKPNSFSLPLKTDVGEDPSEANRCVDAHEEEEGTQEKSI
jgi:hypothetical protein